MNVIMYTVDQILNSGMIKISSFEGGTKIELTYGQIERVYKEIPIEHVVSYKRETMWDANNQKIHVKTLVLLMKTRNIRNALEREVKIMTFEKLINRLLPNAIWIDDKQCAVH